MVDVVVNNLAWAGSGTSVNYSWFNPFNNQRYFHPYKLLSNDPLNETCVEEVRGNVHVRPSIFF